LLFLIGDIYNEEKLKNFEMIIGHCGDMAFLIFKTTVMHRVIFEQLKLSSTDCDQNSPTRHPAKFCCNCWNGCIKSRFLKISAFLNSGRSPSKFIF